VTIAAALRSTGRDVTVEGVVTAPSALLDTSGRRIVIQDPTAAIEILIPKDGTAPALGRRVRASGAVGSAYGAPRLRADTVAVTGAGPLPAPIAVHGALSEAHVWRLVSVQGRIDSVRKLGDRWRAELQVGVARVIVIGQPGARIPVASIISGRTATIVGIVRRAYPSASDRRPSLLPRSAADVHVSSEGTVSGSATPTRRVDSGSGLTPSSGGLGAASSPAPSTVPSVDLDDLDAYEGQIVRAGGLVTDVRSDGFDLDDGRAVGSVALVEGAASYIDLVEAGDAINVTGRVGPVGDGLGIVVDDGGGIVLASDPGAVRDASPMPSDLSSSSAGPAVPVQQAGSIGDLGSLPGAEAGLATLLGISIASVVVTAVRRRQTRRLLAGRVAARLSAIAGPPRPGDPS